MLLNNEFTQCSAMDNLTHSLVGAALGQMGLKRKTGLAMPTLIIAANLPDVDALATVLGTQSLALRRGITHGPIALVLLPLLLVGVMLVYDRWRASCRHPETRVPVHAGWLLVLAYVATLSHPFFDWLNSYGIRVLEPFSSEWFAANTLFIIDLWLWAALILGVWISMRRERRGAANWRSPALTCGAVIVAYIAANGLITGRAETLIHAHVHAQQGHTPTKVVANPVPVAFWQRELLWRDASLQGRGDYSFRLFSEELDLRAPVPHHMDDTRIDAIRTSSPDAAAFLFWSSMPVATFDAGSVTFSDQRFTREITRATFTLKVPLPSPTTPRSP
jgi:inner membrane protein